MSGFVVENGKIVEDYSLTVQEAVDLRETVQTIAVIEAMEDTDDER
jgi:hypothetical protein